MLFNVRSLMGFPFQLRHCSVGGLVALQRIGEFAEGVDNFLKFLRRRLVALQRIGEFAEGVDAWLVFEGLVHALIDFRHKGHA